MLKMFRQFLVCRRQISTTVLRQLENKVPQNQKIFQEANGMPVHLKGGVGDTVLYRATMGFTVLGVACVIYELLKAAVPKKN
ncbi:cytochrome c oxidase subunit 7A2, mitochondrial [Xyrauchen texanus]|uniref:cytochrome c oxidase subunit 7A2, mitochondrial n=1 Tax=Xyrauchen texanus TaxID=154827 RepID=UPI0022419053|nr:cytochrome c oxidase subunit 7A2, mitochondrial [Xyrauchen texanus]